MTHAVPYLGEDDIGAVLTPAVARAATREAFELLAAGRAETGLRQRQLVAGAVTNTMWAAIPERDAIGLKVYPVVRRDVTKGGGFTVVVHQLSSGAVRGVLAADLLGQRRTAAGSVLAAQVLARGNAAVLGLIGTGAQARAHVAAFADSGLIQRVLVAGRHPQRTAEFTRWVREQFDLPAQCADPGAVTSGSDIVVTVTGATEPVLAGCDLRPGCLIIAVGSNQLDKREIDMAALARADRIVVDHRPAAQAEGGDLAHTGPLVDGLVELGQVLLGWAPGRVRAADIIVYSSHGLAIQDLACALAVLDRTASTTAEVTS